MWWVPPYEQDMNRKPKRELQAWVTFLAVLQHTHTHVVSVGVKMRLKPLQKNPNRSCTVTSQTSASTDSPKGCRTCSLTQKSGTREAVGLAWDQLTFLLQNAKHATVQTAVFCALVIYRSAKCKQNRKQSSIMQNSCENMSEREKRKVCDWSKGGSARVTERTRKTCETGAEPSTSHTQHKGSRFAAPGAFSS